MKSVLIGLILTTHLTVFANTVESVFQEHTLLPAEIKQKMIQYITSKCPQDVSAYGLSEVSTRIIDQAELDVEVETAYETIFTSRYYFDGMHPSTQEIKVTTLQREFHGTGFVDFQFSRLITQSGCEQ